MGDGPTNNILLPELYVYAVYLRFKVFVYAGAYAVIFLRFTELGPPCTFSNFLAYIVRVNFFSEVFEYAIFSLPNN